MSILLKSGAKRGIRKENFNGFNESFEQRVRNSVRLTIVIVLKFNLSKNLLVVKSTGNIHGR